MDFSKIAYTKPYDADKNFARFEFKAGSDFKFEGRMCELDAMYCAHWCKPSVVATCPVRVRFGV